ncbi:MAG: NAD-dependent epimerase/dehydratase family protein [Chloroflexaceae bacterium]|nr:NAD-dependent epimerase/dehydratase family protein [Chloroflexaceae bacterium]
MTTVFINGINNQLGSRVARGLQASASVRVLGRAACDPTIMHTHGDLLINDREARSMAGWLHDEQVQVFVHLDMMGEDVPAASREAELQHNVLGTMQILGICAAAGVQRVVLRSSSLVYGAYASNPSFILENQQPLPRLRRSSLLRDYSEIDTFAAQFAASHPTMEVTVLRCAGIVGDTARSPLSDYLQQSAPPMIFGFNPLVQIVHPDDAADAWMRAILAPTAGVFHIAANSLPLVKAIRLTGRQPTLIAEPMIELARWMGRPNPLKRWPYDRDFLRHPCVVDTQRAQAVLGWQARHTAEAILRSLSGGRRATPGQTRLHMQEL